MGKSPCFLRCAWVGSALFAGLLHAPSAGAQGTEAPPLPAEPPASAASPTQPPGGVQQDVVTLTDGREVVGHVTAQVPGSHVTIAYPDGRQETFSWAAIRSVTLAAGRTPPASSSPAPAPAGGGWQGETNGKARYESEVDCSESEDERCKEKRGATVGRTGVGVNFSGQSVRRLKKPPSFHIGMALELNGLYGTGTGDLDATILGYGFLVGARSFFGARLPGPEGGSWHGVGLNAQAHAQGGKLKAGNMDGSSGTSALGVEAGYQYFHFGKLQEKDLTQPGFGLFLGYRVAVQGTTTKMGDRKDTTTGSQHGPSFTLSFPTYNAGTTSIRRWTVSGLVLIIQDFALISLGGGYTW